MWTINMELDEQKLQILLKQAAQEGAREALRGVGLHDDDAGKDISDLRDLIDGWRDVRKTILATFVKWLTLGILSIIAVGVYTKWGK
jgi:hypothetical protein